MPESFGNREMIDKTSVINSHSQLSQCPISSNLYTLLSFGTEYVPDFTVLYAHQLLNCS